MNCTSCKKEIENTAQFCPHCGTEIAKEIQQPQEEIGTKTENNPSNEIVSTSTEKKEEGSPITEKDSESPAIDLGKKNTPESVPLTNENEEEKAYAGFWIRYLANIIDGIVSFIFILVPILVVGSIDIITRPDADDLSFLTYLFIFVMLYPVQLLYFALLEYSPWQATLGKKMFGLIVENEKGEKMTLKISFFRNLMKIIFLQYFAIVLIAPAFTKKKQNPHDIFSNTYVLHKKGKKLY